jgi:AsmA family protein
VENRNRLETQRFFSIMPDQPLVDAGAVAASGAQSPRDRRDPASTALALGFSVVAAIVGLLLLAWLVLFITRGRFLKPYFEKYASQSAGRPVKVAGDFQLFLNPINIRFRAEGLNVANPAWAKRPAFFTSRLIDTSIATIPFIFGTHRANWLLLDGGNVDLEWNAGNKHNTWTFGDPNKPGKPLTMPIIRAATIKGSELHYRDPRLQLFADLRFDTIRAANTKIDSGVDFRGSGTTRGHPFLVTGSLLSPNETVAGGKNRLVLHAQSAANHLDVSGTLPGATVIEGADLTVGVHGPNLAQLFDFLGVAVPPTRAYRFNGHLTKDDGTWRFTRLHGSFGNSDLAGKMTIRLPDNRLKIDADLASDSVDLIDVGPFIGYDPQKLDAQGGKGAIHQVGGTPRILPDAPLRVDAIARFDAHVEYTARTIKQQFVPVSNVSLTFDLDHSKMTLSPMSMDLSRGHLDSDVVIDARQHPVFTDYDIRLSPTPMGTLFKGFGLDESGTSGIIKARIKMSGHGDTLHASLASANGRMAVILPKGSFWQRNVQLSELDVGTYVTKLLGNKLKKPVDVNCGLIAFTVRDGVAAADPILIDTSKNVITGRGGFSFKDESLDLNVRARAKTFSLFSAQSPIGVGGHFAAPGMKLVSPQLLSRGGVAIGLGLLATPVAAILPFVDFGTTPSAQCGPVLAGASAAAQETVKGKPVKGVGRGRK